MGARAFVILEIVDVDGERQRLAAVDDPAVIAVVVRMLADRLGVGLAERALRLVPGADGEDGGGDARAIE